jgi:hypothetical protein
MIYTKTAKGRAEVANREQGLSPVQRRLLILVDGHKSTAELQAFVRVDELDAALAHLQLASLVETTDELDALTVPAAHGFMAANPQETPRAATSPAEFLKVREETSGFVREHLGASGEPICAAIDRCSSPAELRKLLRGVEIFIGERLTAETTQTFARHFGALLL